ncbi:glycosyltransferase [Algibacillus agarilyticus]|uniref:glycosyltransferase n=1 Tax=Algibacillus agarilyticus TaxID=2234133 RepID=UPI000DCFFCC5|nr:glycosyltransferase [Algibacillus agarilyticus]
MKKILIIGWVWPEPKSSAAGYNMQGLLSTLQEQSWEITFASAAQVTDHTLDLASLGINTQTIQVNCSQFDEFILELQPDIVIFDRFMMEEQYAWRVEKHLPNTLRILNSEDLHSLRDARQQHFKHHKQIDPDLNDPAFFDTDLAKREIAAIYRSDLTFIISENEIQFLTDKFNIQSDYLLHMPFMLEPLNSGLPSFNERIDFVTIGNFRHPPNWDAVLWLKQEIWPLIRKKLPKAQLHIYGAYTPPKATQLNNPKEGFLVKGWAEDAYEVIKSAKVCLAPLRFGAGIKGKIADSMICGTPNVTTSIGAEGMSHQLPWSGYISNEAATFAEHAVQLYSSEADWLKKQGNGFDIVQQLFAPEPIKQRLITTINQLSQNLIAHRQANFIGGMLNHHLHKSTKYMSQWIEAKNK